MANSYKFKGVALATTSETTLLTAASTETIIIKSIRVTNNTGNTPTVSMDVADNSASAEFTIFNTKSLTAKKRHKKVLNSTKGHYGARSRLYKTAKQSSIKSMQYAFRDRKNRKRAFRNLWITRINAAARESGTSYSKLINALEKNQIRLNRKILADLSVNDKKVFQEIIKKASG